MPVKGRVVRLVGFGLVLALAAALLPSRGVSAQSVPGRPSGLSVVSVAHDSVALVWDDPGDASVTHYRVLRRDRDVDAVGVFATIEDDTGSAAVSFVDEGAEPSRRYVYRVVAVSEHVESPRSGYVRVDTPAAPVSPGPSGLSGVIGGTRASPGLLWSATMTAGVAALGAADYFGYSEFTSTGALDPTGFDYDGDRVDVVYFGHVPSSGDLYLGLRGPVVGGAVLGVGGGAQFALADAGVDQVGPAWRYRWDAAGIAWGPGDRVEVRLGAVGADEAVPEPPTGFRASMLYGAVQLSWDAAPSSGGVDASYQVWREDTGPGAAGLVQLVQVDGAAFRDSVIAAGSAYRYGVSLRYGQGARSAVSGTVTVQVPPLLADSAPGLERIAVGTSPGVALDPGRSRYDVTLDGPGGETRVELQANAFDAALQGQVVRADDLEVRDQDLAAPVALSEHGDTLMIVRVVSPDGHRRRAYVLRLRPPGDTSTRSLARSASPATRTNHLTQQQATDPRLSALGVSPGSLTPAFAADTFEYTVAVSHDTAQITVAATPAADAAAMVAAADADAVTEGHQVALNAAEPGGPSTQTAIIVVVSNGDRLDSYTIVVNRAAPPSDDTTLSALALTGIELQPAFDAATAAYTATVAHHTETVTVTVTAAATASAATIEIEPADADAVTEGHQIDLAPASTVTVTVTAQDGTTATYTVTVYRASPDAFGWVVVDDFKELAADNHDPWAIWSDGTTMWVNNPWSPNRLFAYGLADMAPDPGKDIAVLRSHVSSLGMWSDGAIIWVAQDGSFDKIYAYDLASGAHRPDRDIDTIDDAGNDSPRGVWSDGTTMWVADDYDNKIYAYDLASGARRPDRDIDTLDDAGNGSPTGVWSDGTTMWVIDDYDDKIYAYELASGTRSPGLDFNTLAAAGNKAPKGLWSDGITMWVSDHVDDRLYAYNMPSKTLLKSLELTGVDIGSFRKSITGYTARVPSTTTSTTVTATAASDGAAVTIAPADADAQAAGHQVSLSTGDNTVTVTVVNGADIRTYTAVITRTTFAALSGDATLSALSLTGVDFGAFSSATTRYAADVRSVTATTVTAAGTDANAAVTVSPADADAQTEGHQVSLAEGVNTITVGVESSDGRHEMTYIVTVYRVSSDAFGWVVVDDFKELAADNHDPWAIWSDGTTMWVNNPWSPNRLFAYGLADMAPDPGKDIAVLRSHVSSLGMWSDGAIIWVAQDGSFDKIYAYDLASGAHRPDRDIDTIDDAGNDSPRGVWSDGTTMWVADGYDRKMFAYDLASGARRPDRDIDTLDDAGNGSPTGVWSDGTTMWVIDDYDDKIYAYELASGTRSPGLDFNTLAAAGNKAPKGLWSDGITMWVSDHVDDRLYAYNMPPAPR